MGPALKEKNLLLKEQILLFLVWTPFLKDFVIHRKKQEVTEVVPLYKNVWCIRTLIGVPIFNLLSNLVISSRYTISMHKFLIYISNVTYKA